MTYIQDIIDKIEETFDCLIPISLEDFIRREVERAQDEAVVEILSDVTQSLRWIDQLLEKS